MTLSLLRRFRLLAVSCVLGFFATLPVLAADPPEPWNAPHFSMDAKALYAASRAAAPDGTDAVVLDEEDVFSFDANGQRTHTAYMVYKVLTQKGVESWGRLANLWQPWRADRPALRARVITPDYVVHELDPKTISDAPARNSDADLYSDERVVRAPLPAIAPGSVVEQELVAVSRPSFPGAGSVSYHDFGRVNIPVEHSLLVVEAPSSFPLQYRMEMLPDLKPQRSETEGRIKLVFERGPIAPLDKMESFLPGDVQGYPIVLFSVGTTWQQVAEGYSRVVEDALGAAEVKSLAGKLTEGKSTRNDKEQAILAFLDKEIRYTGIEFGRNTLIPHSTAETLVRKYGDCKDKALLLTALLRDAGIPAYLALLSTWRGVFVSPELPGANRFNHAIVFVPGDPDQWVDPTDQYARLGQLPRNDQGKWALIVRDGVQGLVRTAEEPLQANVLLQFREIQLAEYGPARIIETIRPSGYLESGYRRNYVDRQNEEIRNHLARYVKTVYSAEKLDRWDRSDPADFSRPFELVLESGKARRGFTDIDSAQAAIRLDGLFGLLPDELQKAEDSGDKGEDATKPKKKRTADYELPGAYVEEWQYKIIPPLGFRPMPLPQDVKQAVGPALLTEQFSADSDGVVHAVIRFDTVKRRFTVAEATEMRNKVAELERGEATMINFEPLGRVLQREGKTRESIQSYRDLIARHPSEAVHHLQLAQALLESGMGEAARNEARLAVKLDPGSALAERTLAGILEYDLVGRKMRPGSDYAGAAEAYRAAERLDPDEKGIMANLAILLEYNEDGLRYGPGAKLREAVAEYRKLTPEKLADMNLQGNPAFALFYAGEFAEAYQYAETLNPQPKALMVACQAALKGSEAGIAEGTKRTSGEADLKETLTTAGDMLNKLRKYPLVADLWQAGASGDNAARTMARVSVFRKARRHEDIQFGNNPRDVTMKFMLLGLEPDATLEKLNSLLSRNAQIIVKNTDPEKTKETLSEGKRLRREVAREGDLWDVNLDFMLQGIDVKDEGNDATGYREKLQLPGGKQMTVFVVKENGQYKLLDTDDDPDAIGLEILDRIDARNLDGARVLLDWVRDGQHLGGGDDPLEGQPFPRFWVKGRKADARQMRLAAAALLVETKEGARRGLSILEEAKKTAASDTERTNINAALLAGHESLDDYAKAFEVSAELAKQFPESAKAFMGQEWVEQALGRYADAKAGAEERLKRIPDDLDAIRALQRNAIAQEDYRAAYDLGRRIVDLGKAQASDFNALAWLTLFFERPQGPDIESALKASQMEQDSHAILHTLGCLYAEAGKTKEAYDVLIQAMDLQDLDEPNPDFWYAFGRIAEQYGERETALADYARVDKPKQALQIPESSYRLAQMRIKALGNNPPPAQASNAAKGRSAN